MGEILITFIKQSSAYKLAKAAKRDDIYVKIVQTPKEISQGGCSYGILAKRKDADRLVNICRKYDIDYRRVLAIYADMRGKKFYSEI